MRVTFIEESPTRGRVTTVYHVTDDLPPEIIAGSVEVLELPPDPQVGIGQSAALFINPTTYELWYELEDRPLTPEEVQLVLLQENQQLKSEILVMQDTINFLLGI